jgi:hypothetical protein
MQTHFLATAEYAGNNRRTSFSMQSAVNTIIEEAVFSMWLAYIVYWATDVLYGLP